MYLDAISVTKPGGAPQQRNRLADPKDGGLQCGRQHSMPFTSKDLEFVTKFTEEFDGDQLRCDHQKGVLVNQTISNSNYSTSAQSRATSI